MTAVSLVGMAHTLALFACGPQGVIIDTAPAAPEVLEHSTVQELLAKFNWTPAYPGAVPLAAHQSAATALGSGVEVIRSAPARGRTYAVPKVVQAVARQGLASKGSQAAADALSISTAELLCSGEPVTVSKIRQIAAVHAIPNSSAAFLQFWGGRPGRKWADGVLARAGLTAAAAPEPDPAATDEGDDEGELIEIPEDATPEEITALMKDGATKVDPAVMFSDIREDSHAFVPSPDNPTSCIYCGSPPDYVIHYLPDRFAQTPDQAHWFEFDPESDNCAVCGKPVDDPIHSLVIQASDAAEGAAEAPLEPEAGPGPGPGPVVASYRPSDVIDTSPALLAALLSAEQSDDQLRYYVRFVPDSGELCDAVLTQDTDGGWAIWDPDSNSWSPTDVPDSPVQLMDEASAYTIADQLSVFPQVSLRSLDLDERALFEAAREGLDDEMVQIDAATYLAVAPDDDEVQYVAVQDPADASAVSQLLANVNATCFTWNYVTNSWDQLDCAEQPVGLSSPITFDDAILIARLQSRDGSALLRPEPEDSDLDQAASELEDTRFFNLFSGTLLPPPERGYDEEDGNSSGLDGLSEDLFCFQIDPENPTQIVALNVQLPDDTWLQWDPSQVTWIPSEPPHNSALVAPREAAEFAAWQYDQQHGGEGGITSLIDADNLLSAIQSAEFSAAFSKVLSLIPRPKSLAEETRPEIYFDDRDDIQVRDVPLRAAGEDQQQQDADGYTAEERSKNAQKQVRDKFGRFAQGQARVALPKGNKGTIRKIDPDRQTVEVVGDDGEIYDLPADQVTVLDEPPPAAKPAEPGKPERQHIDVSKIEAQPRATERTPKAFLPYTLPPMSKEALQNVVSGYQKFIDTERASEDQKRKAKEKLGRAAEEPRD